MREEGGGLGGKLTELRKQVKRKKHGHRSFMEKRISTVMQ